MTTRRFSLIVLPLLAAGPLAAQQEAPPAPAAPRAAAPVPAPASRAAAAPRVTVTAPSVAVGVTTDAQGTDGWLGVGLSCERCSRRGGDRSSARWTFSTPPVVMWLDRNGPAYQAGLRSGDTLTSVDGVALTTPEGGRAFAQIAPGQQVRLGYRREGRERTVRVTAVESPEASAWAAAAGARASAFAAIAAQDEQLQEARAELQRAVREMERAEREYDRSGRAELAPSRERLMAAESALAEIARLRAHAATDAARPRKSRPYAVTVPPGASVWSGTEGYSYSYNSNTDATGAPLRYSGRLGDLVNVEARAPGAVNVSEIGDSAIVVTSGDVVVRIMRRAPEAAPAVPPTPAVAPTPATPRPARTARPRD